MRWGKIGARRMVSTLPFDAEVEWLESTGTQWIDTGYKLSTMNSMRVVLDFSNSGENSRKNIFGSNNEAGFNTYYQQASQFGFYFCGGYVYEGIPISVGVRSTLDISVPKGTSSGVIIYDGVSYNTTARRHVQSDTNFFIFTQVPQSERASKLKVFSCRIFDDGILVRDFIPVRIGSVGALYDRRGVGGMNPDGSARTDGLYFNRGTGAFIVGPDKIA